MSSLRRRLILKRRALEVEEEEVGEEGGLQRNCTAHVGEDEGGTGHVDDDRGSEMEVDTEEEEEEEEEVDVCQIEDEDEETEFLAPVNEGEEPEEEEGGGGGEGEEEGEGEEDLSASATPRNSEPATLPEDSENPSSTFSVEVEVEVDGDEEDVDAPKVSFMRARKLIRVSKEWLRKGHTLEELHRKRVESPAVAEAPAPKPKRVKASPPSDEESEPESESESESEGEAARDGDYEEEDEGGDRDSASSSDSAERENSGSGDSTSEEESGAEERRPAQRNPWRARARRRIPVEEQSESDEDGDVGDDQRGPGQVKIHVDSDDGDLREEVEEIRSVRKPKGIRLPEGSRAPSTGRDGTPEAKRGPLPVTRPASEEPRYKAGILTEFTNEELLDKIIYIYDTDNWYRSKVIQCESTRVQIHFVGWNKKYDKWIQKTSGNVKLEDEIHTTPTGEGTYTPLREDTPNLSARPRRMTPVEERSDDNSEPDESPEPAKGASRRPPAAKASKAAPAPNPSQRLFITNSTTTSTSEGSNGTSPFGFLSSSSALVSHSPTSPSSSPACSSFCPEMASEPCSPADFPQPKRLSPKGTERRAARRPARSSRSTPEVAGNGASSQDDRVEGPGGGLEEDSDYSDVGDSFEGSEDGDDDDDETSGSEDVDTSDSDGDHLPGKKRRLSHKPTKRKAKAPKPFPSEQQQHKGKRGRKPNKKQSIYMRKKEERERLHQQIRCPPGLEFMDYYYCDQCDEPIQFLRFSCCYCGSPDHPDKTYDLCESCFRFDFPGDHEHPQTSFVIKPETLDGSLPEKHFFPDKIDEDYIPVNENAFSVVSIKERQNRICCLCADDENSFDKEDPALQGFIGDGKPIVIDVKGKPGKKSAWVHKACAIACHTVRYREEIDTWYNVAIAVVNGKITKCSGCQLYGASINCMEPSCKRYFHLPCSGTPLSSFQKGLVFFCPAHQQGLRDEFEDMFHCDSCERSINPSEHWYSCQECKDYWSSYDLCRECFEQDFPADHGHGKESFEVTDQGKFRDQDKGYEVTTGFKNPFEKTPASTGAKRGRKRKECKSCRFCNTRESVQWRKDTHGSFVCDVCFDRASSLRGRDASPDVPCSIGDYVHQPYLTRTSFANSKPLSSDALYLPSYGPMPDQLFSLGMPVTFFDIPGRAPRWASHSSHDYSGTWIPQITRWALQRYTLEGEHVVSNFLGRGTDAIEAFLINRPLFGVDINPVALSLTQRNYSFSIPPDLQGRIKASSRPVTLLGSATDLPREIFRDESFGHVLSHPPYHRCIMYSNNIDGDLSRLPSVDAFCDEMFKVARESYRVLKPTRRCTVGIGDNREHCLVLPVSFATIRTYLNAGFEIEELILKRQRCCSGTSKGASLSIVHDFLIITHEYLIVFKKPSVPLEAPEDQFAMDLVTPPTPSPRLPQSRSISVIPEKNLAGQSLVVGTCWTFKDTPSQPLEVQTLTRMVERFGVEGKAIECVEFSPPPEQQQQAKAAEEETTPAGNDDVIEYSGDEDEGPEELDSEESEELSAYEKERQKRIAENNDFLRKQGLVSNERTSHEKVDEDLLNHLLGAKITSAAAAAAAAASKVTGPSPVPKKLSLLFVHATENLPNREAIREYRMRMFQLAEEALTKLFIGGYLIVGVKDVRIVEGQRQNLWPMGMLVCEDLERFRPRGLVLKEIVGVVSRSHSKNRHETKESVTEYVGQTPESDIAHLPIVHTFYLVYSRRDH